MEMNGMLKYWMMEDKYGYRFETVKFETEELIIQRRFIILKQVFQIQINQLKEVKNDKSRGVYSNDIFFRTIL